MPYVCLSPASRGAPPRRDAGARFWTFALAVVLWLGVHPAAAWAHGNLKAARPAAGSRVAAPPAELRLQFTEDPELAFTTVQLTDASGRSVALGPLAVAPDSRRAVVAAVRGGMAAGPYTVVWQMAGDDGHPMRGRYTFTVAGGPAPLGPAPLGPAPLGPAPLGPAPTGPAPAAAGEAGAGVTAPGQSPPPSGHHAVAAADSGFGAGSPLYVAIRWLQYLTLVLLVGAVVFRLCVVGLLRRARANAPDAPVLRDAARGAARLGLWATGGLAVTACLRLYAQSYALHGAGGVFDGAFVGAMLARTVWGWGWLLELTGLLVAAVGFAAARRAAGVAAASSDTADGRPARSDRAGWATAAVGALALSVVPALSGHAAAVPRFRGLAIAADATHVVGASGWLGSLLVVVLVGLPAAMRLSPRERGSAAADFVHAFSPTALVFAGVTAATGLVATWLHVGTVPALWQTTYGRTLLLKLLVLSVVAGTGAYNWLRVRPALGDVEGASRIRRSAAVELMIGAVVLVITAVLVATPTAVDLQAMQHMPGMEQSAGVSATRASAGTP